MFGWFKKKGKGFTLEVEAEPRRVWIESDNPFASHTKEEALLAIESIIKDSELWLRQIKALRNNYYSADMDFWTLVRAEDTCNKKLFFIEEGKNKIENLNRRIQEIADEKE